MVSMARRRQGWVPEPRAEGGARSSPAGYRRGFRRQLAWILPGAGSACLMASLWGLLWQPRQREAAGGNELLGLQLLFI